MRKLLSLFISSLLAATTLVAISSPQALAAPTLTTCTNLETGKTLVLRIADAQCRSHLGSALWVQEQSDTAARTGDGYATITICSSKNPLSTYRLIKDSCPKFLVTTNYWRTVAPPSTPIIQAASASGHDSAALFITPATSAPSAPVLYYLVTDTKSGLTSKVRPGDLGHLYLSGLNAESTYSFTIAAVNVDGTSAISLATPSIRTGAAPVVITTAPIALTCATGGTCVVGDRGPGGGIVYYVATTPFTSAGSTCNTTCRYLEVAPAGWNNGGVVANDPLLVWSTDKASPTGQSVSTVVTESGFEYEKLPWKLGQGFYNTSVMKVTSATSTAQAAVLAYAGSSTAGQWFIPSVNELNELCKFSRGQTTGTLTVACNGTGSLKTGFVGNSYWSSSDFGNPSAWQLSLGGGSRNRTDKDTTSYVRPIRAF